MELQEPVAALCEEIGVPLPSPDSRGVYSLQVDDKELRFFPTPNGRLVLLGVLGQASDLAEKRKQSVRNLLADCLALQSARFVKLGIVPVLTIEPETQELVLWQSFEAPGVSVPGFLQAAESLLNELELWHNWSGLS